MLKNIVACYIHSLCLKTNCFMGTNKTVNGESLTLACCYSILTKLVTIICFKFCAASTQTRVANQGGVDARARERPSKRRYGVYSIGRACSSCSEDVFECRKLGFVCCGCCDAGVCVWVVYGLTLYLPKNHKSCPLNVDWLIVCWFNHWLTYSLLIDSSITSILSIPCLP